MTRFEQRLVEKGLVSPEELPGLVQKARQLRRSLAQILVDEHRLSEAVLLETQAELYGLRHVRLAEQPPAENAIKAVGARLATHYHVLPLRLENGTLTIAVSDPLDMAAVEDLATHLRVRVERVLAARRDIGEGINRAYGSGAGTVERILEGAPAGEIEMLLPQEQSHDLERMAEDASVVQLVNQLLHDAIRDGATDIHFEVHADAVGIRRRIDGILYDATVPRNMRLLYPAIVSRIKLMAGLDIVERRLPQDGRAGVRIGRQEYDLRISVVPAIYGEDVVVRILPASMIFDLEQLGFSEPHQAALNAILGRPHGILFVTGPTGSGKSTTLYACLSRLNTRERKIITIEEPVEYKLRGIIQTQVNTRINLTFARLLRSMLRHDPDVMMVGEVRDQETAEIAIQTAMTGHFVLSTLHTNDAASGPVRLCDMGIDPYLITSSVHAFVAQRLVRRICGQCRVTVERDGVTRYEGRGCDACGHCGYRGRVAIGEILHLDADIQAMILARRSANDIARAAAAKGWTSLFEDGMDKVHRGLTTEAEVLRVTAMD